MKQGLPLLAGLVLSGAAVSPAFSQDQGDLSQAGSRSGLAGLWSAFEVEQEADFDLLLAAGGEDAPHNPPYADFRYRLEAETVRADGLRWGARLALGAVRHDGVRAAGGAVNCAAPCAAPRGLITGLTTEPGAGPAQARAGVERAELYVRHPYAELRVGVTDTAAGLERPARTRAFRLAGADGPLADPTGRTLADTGLSLTSPAPGLSVQSRRIVGVRAALSYTPEADPCGLDHCRPAAAPGAIPEIGAVWSAAASFDRRAPGSGVRWAAYVGGEHGALQGATANGFDDAWTAGLALVREAGPVTVSARWLASNDGLESAHYEALSLSAAYEAGDWLYSVEAGQGESTAFDVSATTFVFGASRFFGRNGLAGAGVQITSHNPGNGPAADDAAVILEAGWRF
ncbi:MAG: hypothetical protein ACFE0P_13205 [Oceanicaulis sp.]